MIDKYTYFNDLQIADFYYILHRLEDKKAITINNKDILDKELIEILKDYEGD